LADFIIIIVIIILQDQAERGQNKDKLFI